MLIEPAPLEGARDPLGVLSPCPVAAGGALALRCSITNVGKCGQA